MSSNPFRGYLIKALHSDEVLPLQFIQYDSYKSTPNQREEIKAYRDDNTRDLTRVTAEGKKSKIEFKTRNLHLAEKMALQGWIGRGEESTTVAHEHREIELEFWDDEENAYSSGLFYIPNIDYEIKYITDDDIIYKEITFKFIEC